MAGKAKLSEQPVDRLADVEVSTQDMISQPHMTRAVMQISPNEDGADLGVHLVVVAEVGERRMLADALQGQA